MNLPHMLFWRRCYVICMSRTTKRQGVRRARLVRMYRNERSIPLAPSLSREILAQDALRRRLRGWTRIYDALFDRELQAREVPAKVRYLRRSIALRCWQGPDCIAATRRKLNRKRRTYGNLPPRFMRYF